MDAHWTPSLLAHLLLALVLLLIDSNRVEAGEQLGGPIPAEIVEVIDGDTLRVAARVWLDQNVEVLVRIRGIDAPERYGDCPEERAAAAAATLALGAAVAGPLVTIVDIERDKYFGRVVADVIAADGASVGTVMLASGRVRPYDGGARQPWCSPAPLAIAPAAEPSANLAATATGLIN